MHRRALAEKGAACRRLVEVCGAIGAARREDGG